MLLHTKKKFTAKIVTYFEVLVVVLLFIALDHISSTVLTPTAALPTSVKTSGNDYMDLILSFQEKKALDLVRV